MLYSLTRVFVQIGGNDIKSDKPAYEVFSDIKNFISSLMEHNGVNEVIIGSLFRRYNPRGMEYKEYEEKRMKINQLLHEEYRSSDNIIFWKLRGLVNLERDSYLYDGIHLSDTAQTKYIRQIKLALFCKIFK